MYEKAVGQVRSGLISNQSEGAVEPSQCTQSGLRGKMTRNLIGAQSTASTKPNPRRWKNHVAKEETHMGATRLTLVDVMSRFIDLYKRERAERVNTNAPLARPDP